MHKVWVAGSTIAGLRRHLLSEMFQILKLCANHVIFKDMSLTPMNASGKSFVWAATDFADDVEGSLEKFAVRFKNPELASKFEECFNKMRELVHVE